VGGVVLGIGLDRPAATPSDTRAATVPPASPAAPGAAPGMVAARDDAERPDGRPAARTGEERPAGETATATTGAVPGARAGAEEGSAVPLRLTVRRGTTLSAIARQVYGSDAPDLIRLILRANPELSDPDLIVAGSTIVVPPRGSGEAFRSER
jgi:nucleoid-associated protein YgaU